MHGALVIHGNFRDVKVVRDPRRRRTGGTKAESRSAPQDAERVYAVLAARHRAWRAVSVSIGRRMHRVPSWMPPARRASSGGLPTHRRKPGHASARALPPEPCALAPAPSFSLSECRREETRGGPPCRGRVLGSPPPNPSNAGGGHPSLRLDAGEGGCGGKPSTSGASRILQARRSCIGTNYRRGSSALRQALRPSTGGQVARTCRTGHLSPPLGEGEGRTQNAGPAARGSGFGPRPLRWLCFALPPSEARDVGATGGASTLGAGRKPALGLTACTCSALS